MALKKIDQNPAITDTVLFDLYTTDANGSRVNPYEVNVATIFFVERDYVKKGFQSYDENIQDFVSTFYFKDAVPFKVFGTEDFPAWLSSDTANAFLTKIDYDEDGNSDIGHFQLQWKPELAREGDYFLCYTWTPIAAGDSFSNVFHFYLGSDQRPPVIPSHLTNPNKYPTLLERYTPEMFKQFLVSADLTPEVLQKTNLAVADGFTLMENFYNQLIDLLDGNVVNEAFLPYLSNYFRMRLRSQDPTLWRRQVKGAIPLLKKKGTLGGLQEALAAAGVNFKRLTYYWQVVSKTTWQEAFVVGSETIFQLEKKAILPATDENFEVHYRPAGGDYQQLTLDYVDFATTLGTNIPCIDNTKDTTFVTWRGQNVYSNPITLAEGDVLRIVYKVAESPDQQLEDYIRTLPLADQRDELDVTLPVKNWNVRLIADDDFLFDVICPIKHPFHYPLVYGKIRTEFPYSENIYNMEEYNGSTRDSTDPCDLDGSFYDTCACCRSSKISVDVEIDKMSNDRISETEEVIKEFVPFHAVVHSVNYVGSHDEIIVPPIEDLECLIQYNLQENLIFSQYDFNRVIHDGLSDVDVIKRNMLADANTVATGNDGVGYNLAYSIFSPGVNFGAIGVKEGNNVLEILSGTYEDVFELTNSGGPTADFVSPSFSIPLDEAGFPFRFSNVQYQENGVSIYQDNLNVFSDENIDFSVIDIPNTSTWIIKVKTGPQAGNYTIKKITSDNSLILNNWVGGNLSNLNYDLVAPGNIVVFSNDTGVVNIKLRGRLETALIQNEYDVKKGDYVEFGGEQYKLMFIDERETGDTVDKVYLEDYADGDQVGALDITVLRRLVDDAVGYVNCRGMKLQTTFNYESTLGIQNGQNPVSNLTETSDFKENYIVLIDDVYYTMSDIDGQSIFLNGPVRSWGLAGETTGLSYTIIQLENHEVTIQNGITGGFETFRPFVDRRGDGSDFVIEQDTSMMPMAFRMQMLNKASEENIEETISAKEKIWYTVVYKEE